MAESYDDRDPQAEGRPTDLRAYVVGLVNAVERGTTQGAAPDGLTSLEFYFLTICLEMEREVTATELAHWLPVDASRISRIVTALVDKGLLLRRRLREDRRVVMLRLSDEGKELTLRVRDRVDAFTASLMEGVGEDELRVFLSVASRIIANHAALQESQEPE